MRAEIRQSRMRGTAEQREFREIASRTWPHTPGGRKIACPDCGGAGYPGLNCAWLDKHASHVTMPCGQVVPASSVRYHNSCSVCHHMERNRP